MLKQLIKWLTPLPKIITLNVTVDDMDTAGGFYGGNSCLLATALKRQLKRKDILVGTVYTEIGKTRYKFDYKFDWEEYELRMKIREPFIITLTKYVDRC
jgi:hypothetical protein